MFSENGSSQRNRKNEQRRLGVFEGQGGKLRNESNQVINPDCAREDNHRKTSARRRILVGGILSQLINDTQDQLAELDRQAQSIQNQSERLRKRLKSFEQLQESLTDEIPDE